MPVFKDAPTSWCETREQRRRSNAGCLSAWIMFSWSSTNHERDCSSWECQQSE